VSLAVFYHSDLTTLLRCQPPILSYFQLNSLSHKVLRYREMSHPKEERQSVVCALGL
ncbi:hypothetical protein AVEN_7800-1, partial [Araneus ventricosus]